METDVNKKNAEGFSKAYGVLALIFKALFCSMSPVVFYCVLILSRGIFINSDKNVLASKGEGLYPYLLCIVGLLLILNLLVQNWSQTKRHGSSGKLKNERRMKIASRVYFVTGVLSLCLMVISFFPRQVLYAGRIDTFNETNSIVSSLSLEDAEIHGISFKRIRRQSYTDYELCVTVKLNESFFEYKIKLKNLMKLYDALYDGSERENKIEVSGEEYYEDYLRSERKLSEQDRAFLSKIVGY